MKYNETTECLNEINTDIYEKTKENPLDLPPNECIIVLCKCAEPIPATVGARS